MTLVNTFDEWIIAEVENRTSTENSLVAREAPVNSGVDGSVLRKGVSQYAKHVKMNRIGAYVKSLDHARESEIVLAKHFQRLECLVVRPILELHSNYIFACSILG